jgi:hypothetical protein
MRTYVKVFQSHYDEHDELTKAINEWVLNDDVQIVAVHTTASHYFIVVTITYHPFVR